MSVWHPPWLCLDSLCWQQLLSHWRILTVEAAAEQVEGRRREMNNKAAQNHIRPKSMLGEFFFFALSSFFFNLFLLLVNEQKGKKKKEARSI